MTLLHKAEISVMDYVAKRQSELWYAAQHARQVNLSAHRAAAVEGIPEDNPLRPIAELLSATIRIGRESDDYPLFQVPESTRDVLRKAYAAGMMGAEPRVGGLLFYTDCDGLISSVCSKSQSDDYNAWKAAKEYREKNDHGES